MELPPNTAESEASAEAVEAGREDAEPGEQEAAEMPVEKVARLEKLTVQGERSIRDAAADLEAASAKLEVKTGEDDAPGLAADKAAVAGFERRLAEARAEADESARAERIAALKEHLTGYLELKSAEDAESLRFETADRLTGDYADQFRALNDPRLNDAMIVTVPDRLWVKGAQPSESAADKNLILVREGYLNDPGKEKQDEVAWMTHELGHLQRGKDVGDRYAAESEEKAFVDLEVGTYPNNKVEEHAFGRQFEYLKSKGVPRARVAEMLKDEYGPEDFKFLDRLLDKVYGK